MSHDLPGPHVSSGFAVDSSLPNWSKHAKTHLRIWESLEVLMPLNTVIPNPGLSTPRCLHLSQIIATLAISNNLIHFKVQGGEKEIPQKSTNNMWEEVGYSQGHTHAIGYKTNHLLHWKEISILLQTTNQISDWTLLQFRKPQRFPNTEPSDQDVLGLVLEATVVWFPVSWRAKLQINWFLISYV